MPKKLDLTDNLEKYIINHSEDLSSVQKKIIEYNNSLGEQKKNYKFLFHRDSFYNQLSKLLK
jgi:hypothetical protein